MKRTAIKLLGVGLGVAVCGVLLGFYIANYLQPQPATVIYKATASGRRVNVTLQTVAAVGHGLHPDWVSYYARSPQGQWEHSTILKVPAHSLIHVTVYNFDGASGLRNPFFGQPRGILGGVMRIDGKSQRKLNPDLASHTFAVPDLHLTVPLKGVADNAPNQCGVAPCALSKAHVKVTFTFRSGAPGVHRWQCFVPCAAGFYLGFGGPMQTIGYMDGLLEVA